MYWSMTCETGSTSAFEPVGRFVLHRHRDASGPHHDLRLEHEGCLLGWRIDGHTLEGRPWATQKAPHPMRWLDHDGEAVREDEGTYGWLEHGPDLRVLALRGRMGERVLRFEREPGLPPESVRAICGSLEQIGAKPEEAARLVADGLTARRRAIERLCGLGRELDGDAFDDGLWRKSLEGLSLDEIHAQLRTYEVRFDLKYPPQPVSVPEPLPEEEPGVGRAEQVLDILRG